jgi:copper chaperone CopZ
MTKTISLAVALLVTSLAARADTIEMKVFGMVCGFCAQGIEASLRKIPATEEVFVSLEHKLVAVRTRTGTDIPDADLEKAIAAAGYDLKSVQRTQRSMQEIRDAHLLASQ